MSPAPWQPHNRLFNTEKTFAQELPRVEQLISTAKRLRKTRAACRKFLALWALQQGLTRSPDKGNDDKSLNDPMNHDWSLLYLGSILDD